MRRPAFQFYPADWRKDAELQSCSIGARGLWHEIMCLMHECDPYGHLVVNGKPMDADKAARLCGVTLREYSKLTTELIDAGVPSFTGDGVMYSRRMVRDEQLRNARATGGQLGAEHGSKGAEHGSKGGRPRAETGLNKPPLYDADSPPLKPPPSSSSSPSASTGLNGRASDFESFWHLYPKHVARKQAEQSFVKAIERADISVILEGTRLYANSRLNEDPKFTKSPHNWLDADGWTEFGAKSERLTPEQDAASRDKADRLLKRGKYAVTS